MRQPLTKSRPACLFASFRWTFLCLKREIEPEPPKIPSIQLKAPPESLCTCFFYNTSPVRNLQTISQCMPPQSRQFSTAQEWCANGKADAI